MKTSIQQVLITICTRLLWARPETLQALKSHQTAAIPRLQNRRQQKGTNNALETHPGTYKYRAWLVFPHERLYGRFATRTLALGTLS